MVEKAGTVYAKLCSLPCIFLFTGHQIQTKQLPAQGRKVLDIGSSESK
jgi:hypothetical protein